MKRPARQRTPRARPTTTTNVIETFGLDIDAILGRIDDEIESCLQQIVARNPESVDVAILRALGAHVEVISRVSDYEGQVTGVEVQYRRDRLVTEVILRRTPRRTSAVSFDDLRKVRPVTITREGRTMVIVDEPTTVRAPRLAHETPCAARPDRSR